VASESNSAEHVSADPISRRLGPRALAPLLAQLVRQGLGFTIVGAAQLLLDWGVMVGLSALGLDLSLANVLGRAAGASLGFWGNGRLTFAGGRDTWTRQGARFLALWLVLTLLSTLAVNVVAHYGSHAEAWLLKPLIEASLSLISFFSCRHWVFR
jgi:putative flippase GtrA